MTAKKLSQKIRVVAPKRKRRRSKPAASAPHRVRRCILVDCDSEAIQRELFESLKRQGASCRLLIL